MMIYKRKNTKQIYLKYDKIIEIFLKVLLLSHHKLLVKNFFPSFSFLYCKSEKLGDNWTKIINVIKDVKEVDIYLNSEKSEIIELFNEQLKESWKTYKLILEVMMLENITY